MSTTSLTGYLKQRVHGFIDIAGCHVTAQQWMTIKFDRRLFARKDLFRPWLYRDLLHSQSLGGKRVALNGCELGAHAP
jgi:hypothetical protein